MFSKKTTVKLMLPAFALGAFFAACSNDDPISDSKIETVAEADSLPGCDASNEGEMVLVKSDLSLRVCVNKKWAEIIQNSDGSYDYKCETKALKDSSGIKIICGGDSIGVLKNLVGKEGGKGDQGVKGDSGVAGPQGDPGEAGKSCTAEILADFTGMKMICGGDSVGVIRNGNDGDNGANGAGCSLKQLDETQLQIKCGNDSTTFFVHSESQSSSREAAASGALSKPTTITGTAALGPFENGSVVTLKEMRIQGDSLSYTGREFTGEVSGLKGNYVIPDVTLDYPYAEVSVTGKWRNEVTGKNSTEDMTLYALTDLSNGRTEVNVNLMTHLEYARIKNLVKEKKYSVQAAKTIADNAIVSSFGLSTDMGLAEDLVTFKSSAMDNTKANATLLAMAFLFVRDNDTDAKIKASIENFVNDFAADGKWDDANGEKKKMASWAANYDADGINLNIATGGIADIPSYTTQLSTFLGIHYGIGLCDANRDGEVVTAHANDDGSHYICKTSAGALEGPIWQTATLVEWECYGKKAPKVNESRVYKAASGNIYVYDDGLEKWRNTQDENEKVMFNELYDNLAAENLNDIITTSKMLGRWIYLVAKGSTTGKCYVLQRVDKSENVYAIAEPDSGIKYSFVEYPEYQADTIGLSKTDGKEKGRCSGKDYVYTNKRWRNLTELEVRFERLCTVSGEGLRHIYETTLKGTDSVIVKDSILECAGGEYWRYVTKNEFHYGLLNDGRDGKQYKTVKIGDQIWMADDLEREINSFDELADACPDHWHVPTEEEAKTLIMTVDNKDNYTDENNAGTKLSSPNHQVGTTSKPLPTNDYGFSIETLSNSTRSYWISSAGEVNNFETLDNSPSIQFSFVAQGGGLRVRCIQDAPTP